MALHPGQHLVDPAHLPAPVRVSSVAEQRVRFVEDEECLRVAGRGERGRELLFGLADPHREQIGRALLEDLESKALGEVARERALAGAGWTLRRPFAPEHPGEETAVLIAISFSLVGAVPNRRNFDGGMFTNTINSHIL